MSIDTPDNTPDLVGPTTESATDQSGSPGDSLLDSELADEHTPFDTSDVVESSNTTALAEVQETNPPEGQYDATAAPFFLGAVGIGLLSAAWGRFSDWLSDRLSRAQDGPTDGDSSPDPESDTGEPDLDITIIWPKKLEPDPDGEPGSLAEPSPDPGERADPNAGQTFAGQGARMYDQIEKLESRYGGSLGIEKAVIGLFLLGAVLHRWIGGRSSGRDSDGQPDDEDRPRS